MRLQLLLWEGSFRSSNDTTAYCVEVLRQIHFVRLPLGTSATVFKRTATISWCIALMSLSLIVPNLALEHIAQSTAHVEKRPQTGVLKDLISSLVDSVHLGEQMLQWVQNHYGKR